MVMRTRAHELEDLAKARLVEFFAKTGWTVETLSKDYGEDFFVRIFEQGNATPFGFFVQSKATDSLDRYKSVDSTYFSYPVTTKHLEHWDRFWEPVLLTLFDASTGNVYWQIIQSWFQKLSEQRRITIKKRVSVSVHIPAANLLGNSGLDKIKQMTVARFNRFENEQVGANHLISCIREKIGIDISYDAQAGIFIVPKGKFVASADGSSTVFVFGKTLAMLGEISEVNDLSGQNMIKKLIDDAYQSAITLRPRKINHLDQLLDYDV